jgi:hypothetical protein
MDVLWQSTVNYGPDVKELTPEFYFDPEFLTNYENLELGITPDGDVISDIVLPPWAKV